MRTYATLLLSAFLGALGTASSLHAAAYTFDNTNTAGLQDGGGNWNTSTANWWNGSGNVAWPNLDTDEAIFGVSSTGTNNTINVSSVTTNKITFAALSAGNYQLFGGAIALGGTSPSIVANNTVANGQVIRSALTGTSGFSKTGAGTLTFGATGATSVNLSGLSGTIDLSGGNVFLAETGGGSAAAAWNISTSGTNLGLSVTGTISLGSLSGVTNSVLRTGGTNSPIASIGALNTDTTFSGNITGTIAITKVGTGTLTLAALSAKNTYTGATKIDAGTLALAAGSSINKTPAIAVASGAIYDVSAVTGYTLGSTAAQTLKGAGTVNGSTTIAATNGTLIAGDVGTVGTLTFNNDLILAGTTSLDIVGVTDGTHDKISVGGTLTAGGLLQLVIDSNFASTLSTAGGSATLTLFTVSSATNFSSIVMTGLDSGTFATTTAGSSLVGATSGITYTWNGDGTLLVAAIPEPSAYAAVFGALALAGAVWRSRRRA
ncbi:MAG: autotransporter-associated beta strand repeat-containing protein [Opitutaceae bacterium]|jgi:autotransporter-associated beta strand protein